MYVDVSLDADMLGGRPIAWSARADADVMDDVGVMDVVDAVGVAGVTGMDGTVLSDVARVSVRLTVAVLVGMLDAVLPDVGDVMFGAVSVLPGVGVVLLMITLCCPFATAAACARANLAALDRADAMIVCPTSTSASTSSSIDVRRERATVKKRSLSSSVRWDDVGRERAAWDGGVPMGVMVALCVDDDVDATDACNSAGDTDCKLVSSCNAVDVRCAWLMGVATPSSSHSCNSISHVATPYGVDSVGVRMGERNSSSVCNRVMVAVCVAADALLVACNAVNPPDISRVMHVWMRVASDSVNDSSV